MTNEPTWPKAVPPGKAKRSPPVIKAAENKRGILEVSIEGDLDRLAHDSVSKPVALGLIGQMAGHGSHGNRIDESASNFVLSFVDDMKPRDAAEALLLTQMAVTHQATMMLARRLNHVSTLQQQDAAERALNKLGRTFAMQMETLKRYRSKGQQTVRVERVTVEQGGQAIVGTVERGRGIDES